MLGTSYHVLSAWYSVLSVSIIWYLNAKYLVLGSCLCLLVISSAFTDLSMEYVGRWAGVLVLATGHMSTIYLLMSSVCMTSYLSPISDLSTIGSGYQWRIVRLSWAISCWLSWRCLDTYYPDGCTASTPIMVSVSLCLPLWGRGTWGTWGTRD